MCEPTSTTQEGNTDHPCFSLAVGTKFLRKYVWRCVWAAIGMEHGLSRAVYAAVGYARCMIGRIGGLHLHERRMPCFAWTSDVTGILADVHRGSWSLGVGLLACASEPVHFSLLLLDFLFDVYRVGWIMLIATRRGIGMGRRGRLANSQRYYRLVGAVRGLRRQQDIDFISRLRGRLSGRKIVLTRGSRFDAQPVTSPL